VIDTEPKLASFLPNLGSATWVAVDTEADSLHAYPEKVCLIQISTVAGDELVDPLADIDLAPLLEALSGHELIMHGADYDLRLLMKHHEFVPSAIFDTMLAARLLGERQFGYSSLVEKFLGVKLEKGPQKANWAIRPLTERMEKYARNDTHYLRSLEDKLRAELAAKGRLGWHQESCVRLIEECTQPRPIEADAVWRVKGSHVLGRHGLAFLRELWQWRETEAIAANRPPFFVMSHETLVDIAAAATTQRPVDPLIPKHLSDRRRAGVTKALTQAGQVSPEKYPRMIERTNHRPSETERRRFLELEKHRDARAGELAIDPTLIASRATLSDLARDWNENASQLMNWQRELLKA
jgi:ribonuclease D